MSEFDPYYKWLGIPPEEQPPTHYRLLGIQVLEQNVEVIESAANRQMAYLQELSGGDEHIDEAQRLLGEVAKARVCLLSAESKARYDAEIAASLDSLPEAEDATDTADVAEAVEEPSTDAEPAAKPPEMKRGARARRSTSSGGARKTTAGRSRTGRTQKSGSGSSKSRGGSKSKASNDLAIKIGALAGTAVFVLVVGILLLGGGGSNGGKKSRSKQASKPKSSSSSVASKSVQKTPVRTAAEKKKADRDLERQVARIKDDSPTAPAPRRQDESTQPATASVTPTEDITAEDTDTTEITVAEIPEEELSEEKKARRRLEKDYELEENDFEHTWHLANNQTRKLAVLEASGGSSTGNAEFEAELQRRVDAKKKEIMDRWIWVSQQPAGNPQLDAEYYHLMTIVAYPANPEARYVRDDISEINSIRTQVEQEFTARKPTSVDPGKIKLIKDIRTRYAELAENSEVTNLLEKAGGTLAEAPEIPDTANDIQAETPPPAEEPSAPAKTSDQVVRTEIGAAGSDAADEAKDEKDAGGKSEESTVSFDELKKNLTSLEEEIEKLRDNFNSEAKDYKKKKSKLSTRIKNGEKLQAIESARLRRMPEYTEAERLKKREAGKEFEKKISGPLKALKSEREGIPKPKAATPLEEKLKQAEKMVEQLKATSEYAENPKSVDSLAAAIAIYRKGFEVQQGKMAK